MIDPDREKIIKGFLIAIERIKNNGYRNSNHAGICLSHAEVRSLARSCLCVLDSIIFNEDRRNEIYFLLTTLATRGLPHYDRSYLAERIVELLKESLSAIKEKNIYEIPI